MKRFSIAALTASALVAIGATAVVAQQQIPPPPFMQQNQQPNAGAGGPGQMGPGQMGPGQMGPGQMGPGARMRGPMAKMSTEDRQAFFNAKIAAVHAGLALTPDQEKLWPQAESAAREFAATMMARREAMQKQREEMRAGGKTPDFIAIMRARADAMVARGEAMKKALDGVGPLYATLTAEQKARLGHLAGRRFRHEMRGWGDDMRGMDHGWGPWGHHHRGWWRG